MSYDISTTSRLTELADKYSIPHTGIIVSNYTNGKEATVILGPGYNIQKLPRLGESVNSCMVQDYRRPAADFDSFILENNLVDRLSIIDPMNVSITIENLANFKGKMAPPKDKDGNPIKDHPDFKKHGKDHKDYPSNEE